MVFTNLLLTAFNLVLFFAILLFVCLLPGLWFLRFRKLPFLDKLFFSFSLGFALYVLTVYAFRTAGLPFFTVFILPIFFALKYLNNRAFNPSAIPAGVRAFSVKAGIQQKLFLVIAFLGMLVQGIVLFNSGFKSEAGLEFNELSYHDSIWHIYLINELQENFPPRHGGFSGALINNYHFLSDLTVASIAKYFPLNTLELYFRALPAFVSLYLSLAVFVFARRLTSSEQTANFALLLTLFSGNAAWFVKFFRGSEFQVSANTFMLDPVLDLLQNPHAVIVFPLLLAGIYGLLLLQKKPALRLKLFTGIIFGVIIGFKAWGGALALLSLGITAVYSLLFMKKSYPFFVFVTALTVSIFIFLPHYNPATAVGPLFAPGWLLKRMVEDPDRVNYVQHFFLEQHYQATRNLPRLILLNGTQVIIYLFGNLWVRSLGLIYLFYSLYRPTVAGIFTFSVFLFSLALPLLFNQGSMAYDIIQFAPYAQVIISIYTAASIKLIFPKISKKRACFLLLFIVLFSFPSNWVSVKNRFKSERRIFSSQLLEAYSFIEKETDPGSVILVYPSPLNLRTAAAAAFSRRQTYFSANTFARITGEDYQKRENTVKEFFTENDSQLRRNLLTEENISYIFLTADEDLNFKKNDLDLNAVFRNDAAVIYQLN